MIAPAEREKEVLSFLRAHFETYGVAPPQYQVAIHIGLSPSSTDHVRAIYASLERAGLLRRMSGDGWRHIKLVEAEDDNAADRARAVPADATYRRYLDLIEALQRSPKIGLAPRLRGLTPLSESTKADWLKRLPLHCNRSAA